MSSPPAAPEAQPDAGTDPSADTGPVPGERVLRAWRSWLPYAAVLVAMLIVASVLVSLATGAPTPQSASCPPVGSWPAVGVGPPAFTDNNISVYVGGDLASTGADLESEGLLVVGGDVSLAASGGTGVTGVGATRAGTGVAPTPGTTMLAVGGDLSVRPDAALELGRGVPGGGNLVVGGSVTPGATIVTHGGSVDEKAGPAAFGSFRRFGDTLPARSQELAGLQVTGTTTVIGRSLFSSATAGRRSKSLPPTVGPSAGPLSSTSPGFPRGRAS